MRNVDFLSSFHVSRYMTEDSFSLRLVRIMSARQMTVAELSRKTGLAYQMLYGYIKGYRHGRKPSIGSLAKICKALDCAPEELLGGGNPHNEKVAKFFELYEALDDTDPRKKAINTLLGLEPDKEEK